MENLIREEFLKKEVTDLINKASEIYKYYGNADKIDFLSDFAHREIVSMGEDFLNIQHEINACDEWKRGDRETPLPYKAKPYGGALDLSIDILVKVLKIAALCNIKYKEANPEPEENVGTILCEKYHYNARIIKRELKEFDEYVEKTRDIHWVAKENIDSFIRSIKSCIFGHWRSGV